MSQFRVRTQDQNVGSRMVPISHVLVSATTSGGANTVFTVRDGVLLVVRQLALANVTGTAATVSINTVPAGGAIGDGNAEMKGVSVPANSTTDITDKIGQFYAAGTVMKAYSGTTNAIVVHGWAEEIL